MNKHQIVQGTGSYFIMTKTSSILKVLNLDKRVPLSDDVIQSTKYSALFCECRNLNKTTRHLEGVLVSFIGKNNPTKYKLGIILFMNTSKCVLACYSNTNYMNDQVLGMSATNHNDQGSVKDEKLLKTFTEKKVLMPLDDVIKMHYLNMLDCKDNFVLGDFVRENKNNKCTIDNCLRGRVTPDIVVQYKDYPSSWKDLVNLTKRNNDHCINTHHATKRYIRVNTNRSIPLPVSSTKKVKLNNIRVHNKILRFVNEVTLDICDDNNVLDTFREGCFYVPYVFQNQMKSNDSNPLLKQRFGLLTYDSVKNLISVKTRSVQEHNNC